MAPNLQRKVSTISNATAGPTAATDRLNYSPGICRMWFVLDFTVRHRVRLFHIRSTNSYLYEYD